jgi:plastocyanin
VALAGAAACAAAPVSFAQHEHGTGVAAGPMVTAGFDSFSPQRITALAGETVMWMNDSSRAHTVTANDGSFDSGHIPVTGSYEAHFATAGTFRYHCTLHPFMTGDVDVYDVLLNAPSAPAGPRLAYTIRGRSALPSGTPVTIEADTGSGFAPAATATVADDGTFTASVVPTATWTLRAVAGTVASPPVQLIVVDHTVKATVKRLKGHRVQVDATVTPAAPGSKVILQLHLRERFGWWTEQTRRLDRNSHARFVIHQRGRVPARVALTLPDGATVLATSAIKRRY